MAGVYPKGISFRAYQEGAKSALISEVDPLTCPKCAGEMRIISFIYQRYVIRKILEHLKIYEDNPVRASPQKKIAEKKAEMVPFDDGWPGYEETVFEM